jgi:hypothetical protein
VFFFFFFLFFFPSYATPFFFYFFFGGGGGGGGAGAGERFYTDLLSDTCVGRSCKNFEKRKFIPRDSIL